MAIVAVAGDACTTTTVALAAAWRSVDDVFIVEADPSGGDLAAWFDVPTTPSLSTVVTRLTDGSATELERHTRLAPCGLRLIPAPTTVAEAQQAVAQSARHIVPTLAASASPVAIVDTGTLAGGPGSHPFVVASTVTVVVHRQSTQSARAAAVRLQRMCDQVEALSSRACRVIVAVIGSTPFGVDQIEALLADSIGSGEIVTLPVDDLTASVYAGRTGISPRRLARLPLARAARRLADVVGTALDERAVVSWRSAR